MPEDIFEESQIAIKATLKEDGFFSGSYTGKLDLIYQKNGAEIKKDADIDVPKGSIDRTYKVPLVEGTEDTYNLKIVAHFGKAKEKTRLLVDATIWPKKMKLTAKDGKDDSLIKKLPYEIHHTALWFGATVAGNTNDSGVGNEDLKKSSYTISAKAPWEIVSNKNDAHKREHDIVLRSNPKAKFLKPDLSQDCYVAASPGADKKLGVRQFVNMTTAEAGCDAKGSIIEFEVCNKDKPLGIKDDKIYIQVKFGKLSKRSTPKPALLGPCQDIAEKDAGKTFTGYVKLDADAGTAKFKLELGHAGGETFTVTCGYSKDDPTDDKLIFVSWRKLGYQLRFPTVMKTRLSEATRKDATKYTDISSSIKSVVDGRLGAVFIEYENLKSHEYPDPPVGAPAIVTKGFLDCTTDATPLFVLDGSSNWASTATAFDACADNREIHVTLCDRAYSGGGKTLSPTFTMEAVDLQGNIDGDASYLYFVKTHKAADTPNFVTAGYEWAADLSGVAANDKNQKPTCTVTFAKSDFDDWNDFTVEEKDAGGGTSTLSFGDDDALSTSQKAALKTYYENCFNNAKAIRKNQNKLTLIVSGGDSDSGDKARSQAIISELNSIHAASAKKVQYHPGLDEDCNPRKGPMTDCTMTHIDGRCKKFTLATGGPEKPGDFAGPASATKCPVTIEFKMDGTYAINGNAGSGKQLLVLRDATPGPCASTVCHELGHSMGMAVMPLTGAWAYPVPPGLTTPLHVDNGGTYYVNGSAPFTNGVRNLHVGPHCCEGMPDGNRSDPKFNNWDPSAGDRCIMWGSGGDADIRKQYCPVCTEVLKARKLTDLRGAWAGRADG